MRGRHSFGRPAVDIRVRGCLRPRRSRRSQRGGRDTTPCRAASRGMRWPRRLAGLLKVPGEPAHGLLRWRRRMRAPGSRWRRGMRAPGSCSRRGIRAPGERWCRERGALHRSPSPRRLRRRWYNALRPACSRSALIARHRGRQDPRIVARRVFSDRDEVWAFEAADRLTRIHTAQGVFDIDLSLTACKPRFDAPSHAPTATGSSTSPTSRSLSAMARPGCGVQRDRTRRPWTPRARRT